MKYRKDETGYLTTEGLREEHNRKITEVKKIFMAFDTRHRERMLKAMSLLHDVYESLETYELASLGLERWWGPGQLEERTGQDPAAG